MKIQSEESYKERKNDSVSPARLFQRHIAHTWRCINTMLKKNSNQSNKQTNKSKL